MKSDSKIYLAGHGGLVGQAILKKLRDIGYSNIITRSLSKLDLTDQAMVEKFFCEEKPEYVFLAAAKVGGIIANSTYPADFIYQNIMIQNNIIHQSFVNDVKNLLFLGSSCIYPCLCPQPIKEDHLMTGPLEPSNSPYAIAKISGIEMCWSYNRQYNTNYIPVMPTNLYGPNDNFDLETSHVLPALLRKFHEAKESSEEQVIVWGSGTPKREFLHVQDMADACVYIMKNSDKLIKDNVKPLFNIGTGVDITIKELAEVIKDIVGFKGKIVWDESKPDGTPQKRLDVSKLKTNGWKAEIGLQEGIRQTYEWYLQKTIAQARENKG